ncbi:MAG TPA: asparagine synthase (glutamine-hydrolyzing) [bacterium]|nr:asparagine synthase (glutamine-hydrolyzing) [bacterium]
MCGICGFAFDKYDIESKKKIINKMTAICSYRGPDEENTYISDNIALGHNRLSIIDLSGGSQPMVDATDRFVIVYNGEIYNFLEHRENLIKKGYTFKTRSDTEVILNLYREHGTDCLQYLRGMFAFAIWDKAECSLFLARDRLGVKPLVYAQINNTIYFASEIKQLLEIPEFNEEINYSAINYYLTLQYIPSSISIFKNVKKLKPGHYLYFKNNNLKIERYWNLNFQKNHSLSFEDWCQKFFDTFSEAAHLRLISDVPVGVFLSGGIDSTSTVAILSKVSTKKLKTYTMGFANKEFDEIQYARQIAKMYDTEHTEVNIELNDYDFIPKLIWHLNEPLADSAILPKYFISRAAREYVKVVISGDGGDESAVGYHRYSWIKFAEYYDALPKFLRKNIIQNINNLLPLDENNINKISKLKKFINTLNLEKLDRYLRWVAYFPNQDKEKLILKNSIIKNDYNEIYEYFFKIYSSANADNEVDKILYLDTHTYLPDDILTITDIASMAVSLEIRSPYLDYQMYELFAQMPIKYKFSNFTKKYFLKKVLKDLLPTDILTKKKTGFSIPISQLLRTDLKYLINDYLLSEKFLKRKLFDVNFVKYLIDAHLSNRADFGFRLWALITLEIWFRIFVDKEIKF